MIKIISLYALALVYIGAGIYHFINPRFYLRIIPPYLPAHAALNYISGFLEIIFGGLLLIKNTRLYAAWGIALLLVLFLTVHIYMLQQSYRQEHYLVTPTIAWLRLLLQPLLIVWALWHARAD